MPGTPEESRSRRPLLSVSWWWVPTGTTPGGLAYSMHCLVSAASLSVTFRTWAVWRARWNEVMEVPGNGFLHYKTSHTWRQLKERHAPWTCYRRARHGTGHPPAYNIVTLALCNAPAWHHYRIKALLQSPQSPWQSALHLGGGQLFTEFNHAPSNRMLLSCDCQKEFATVFKKYLKMFSSVACPPPASTPRIWNHHEKVSWIKLGMITFHLMLVPSLEVKSQFASVGIKKYVICRGTIKKKGMKS